MKRQFVLIGIASVILAMVFAGCEQPYNGPSTDEIADKVYKTSLIEGAKTIIPSGLEWSGEFTTVKAISAWGQTDAAYTLKVNNAQTKDIELPGVYGSYSTAWECPSPTEDAGMWELNGRQYIWVSDKKTGFTAADFTFTITYTGDSSKTVKGKLTVQAEYNASSVPVPSSLVSKFKDEAYLNNSDAVTDIATWGQTSAELTLASTRGSAYLSLPSSLDFYENGQSQSARVEWKTPASLPAGLSASVYSSGGSSSYNLSTSSETQLSAEFPFRITSGANSELQVSGKITVKVSYQEPDPADLEKAYVEDLRSSFLNLVRDPAVVALYEDKAIAAISQTDAKYSITVKYSNGYYSDENGNYVTLYLPNGSAVAWTGADPANNAAKLDASSNQLKVYQNKSGTAAYNFTYTYAANKTVTGTLDVRVIE